MLDMMTSTPSSRTTHPEPQDAGDLSKLTAELRDNILEAQTMLAEGRMREAEALGKATLQLIRALEAQVKLETSQTSEQREGVFLAREDIEAARADLLRRLGRISKTIRAGRLGEGAE